jgi:hypothetical protein
MPTTAVDYEQIYLPEGFSLVGGSGNIPSIKRTKPEYSESIPISSQTTATLQDKINFTTTSLPIGIYKVEWFCQWSCSATNRQTRLVVSIDSTIYYDESMTPHVSNPSYFIRSGFFYVTFASETTHTLLIQYARGSGAATAYIKDTRIEIKQFT